MKHKNKVRYAAIWQNGKVIEIIADTSWISLVQHVSKAYFSLASNPETFATDCNEEQKIGDTVLLHDDYTPGNSIAEFKFNF